MNYNELKGMVETALVNLGHHPSSTVESAGKWKITHLSSTVWIDLYDFPATSPGVYYFQALSALFKVPQTNREAIAEELLEVSYEMCYSRVVKSGDWYYIGMYRPALNITQEDINYMIEKAAFYSDDYYNKLSYKYKGSWPTSINPSTNSNTTASDDTSSDTTDTKPGRVID